MIQINGNVSGVPTAPVDFVLDNAHTYPVTVDGGRFTITVPVPEPSPYGAAIVSAGRQLARLLVPPPGAWEADQPPVSMDPPSLKFGPIVSPVAKLTTSGRDFVLNGSRWLWKGSSDFRLYQWYLEGRDLQPVLDQRREAGANLLRVFGMYNGGIGRFIPSEYPAYFGAFPAFADRLAHAGFQFELTAFADAQNILSQSNQHAHWSVLESALQGIPNCLVELVNEYPQNGVDPAQFSPLIGLLCSRGSNVSDTAGYQPGWSYQTWHGRRDWPKVLFSAEDMWWVGEGVGSNGQQFSPTMPVIHDEPIGFSDVNQPGRRSNDPYVARVLGQTGAAFGCGSTFHSDAGIQSDLWSPQVDLCARTFYGSY